jgi:hypothetical protein
VQRTWEGIALIAVRQDGSARPGLSAVITADLDEMRSALLEGQGLEGQGLEAQRPGAGSLTVCLVRWRG